MSLHRGLAKSRSVRNEKAVGIIESFTNQDRKKESFVTETVHPYKVDIGRPGETATPFLIPSIGGESQENRERERVFLTHFVSPGEFYVQNSSAQLTYKNIQSKLDSLLEKKQSEAFIVDQIDTGKLYAVKLADGLSLERCKILSLNSSSEEAFTVQLIDVGPMKSVSKAQLIDIDAALSEVPPAAKLCNVWGLCPAGHYTKWSFASTEKALTLLKSAAAYIKEYHTEKKEEFVLTVHYVRLFFEQVQQGGALECDQHITICFNDSLFESALAIRHPMPVTIQPSSGWPTQRSEIPDEFIATPLYFDDDALVYLHPMGPYDQKEAITELLNWYYSKIKREELNSWVHGEACIVKGLLSDVKELDKKEELDDTCHYRGIISATNEEEKKATVFLIDYAKSLDYKYENMFKTLIAFEYAPQAWRCGLLRYPAKKPIQDEELGILDHVFLKKECFVSVKTRGKVPLVDIMLRNDEGLEMAKVYNLLRSDSIPLPDTPTPTPSPDITEETFLTTFSLESAKESSSNRNKAIHRRVNPLALASDSDSSSEDGPPRGGPLRKSSEVETPVSDAPSVIQILPPKEAIVTNRETVDLVSLNSSDTDSGELDRGVSETSSKFNFEHSLKPRQFKVFQRLIAPLRKLVPLRILKIDGNFVWVQPARYQFKEGPIEWETQYENFVGLHSELQRAAPRFPVFKEVNRGFYPCACLNPNDNKWYRGVISHVFYRATTTVKLIDIAEDVEVAKENIRQLPAEYMNLPENALRCRLETVHPEENSSKPLFPMLRRFISEGKRFYGLIKFRKDPGEKPIISVNLRYKDEDGYWISALDNMF